MKSIITILLFSFLFSTHAASEEPTTVAEADKVEVLLDRFSNVSYENVDYFYVSKAMMHMVRNMDIMRGMKTSKELLSKIDFIKGFNVKFAKVEISEDDERYGELQERLSKAETQHEQEAVLKKLRNYKKQGREEKGHANDPSFIRDYIDKIKAFATEDEYEQLMVTKDGTNVASIYFKRMRSGKSVVLFMTQQQYSVSVVYIKGDFSTMDLMDGLNIMPYRQSNP